MLFRHHIRRLSSLLRDFGLRTNGNVAITFSVMLIPVAGGVGAALDYSRASSVRAAMQAAADAASLGIVKSAASLPAPELTAKTTSLFNASYNRHDGAVPAVNSSYDAASKTVTVTATASVDAALMGLVGISKIPVTVTSKASIGGRTWQICVMVTEETDNHTLLTKGGAQINFDNCMVQVNTNHWDAVEARDTSYIRSKNGENCFVGDIHYGDVTPPKNPSCTFFDDPFAALEAPASKNTCTYTNVSVTTPGQTLYPGTYCGGLNINASATLSPGLYIVTGGTFRVTGSGNITANGVTIILANVSDNFDINTSGTFTMTPMTSGDFAGFLFLNDNPDPAAPKKKKKKSGKSTIAKTTFNGQGVIYIAGQRFEITNNAVVNLNPGSIIADYILPDTGARLNLTGKINSSGALSQLLKTSETSGTPRLVK